MRPARFQTFLLDAVTAAGARAQSLADAGDSKHPFGVVVAGPGGESRWQITGQLAEGERHEHAEAPMEGDPAAWTDASADAGPDAWLAAVIGRVESPEIARIDRWSAREGAKAGREGLTIFFHNGARAYVRKI
ncbi:hypothetical protein [Streptomyces sp. NPDC002644]